MSPAISRTVIALAIGIAAIGSAAAETVTGVPRIVDGDTVEIGAEKVRLSGVDAPETDQACLDAKGARFPCGVGARDALEHRYGGKPWRCEGTTRDQSHRLVGRCEVEGADVQAWLVREGWALAFVRYSKAYVDEERAARDTHTGLWAGCFVKPWEYRHQDARTVYEGTVCPVDAREKLRPVSAEGAPDPACTLKANLSAKGGCIFHRPGGLSYGTLDMGKSGRRWFCTEAEAEAAGCRRAMR